MTKSELIEFYEYHCWANARLFEVINQLSAEEFAQEVAGSYGSVCNTLVHILSAEWGWLSRCGGQERGRALQASDFPDAGSLRAKMYEVEGYVRSFLSQHDDASIMSEVEYVGGGSEKRRMPIMELMHHALNHAVHHRGQVALLLRMLGHRPGNFDMLFYYAEKRGVKAW